MTTFQEMTKKQLVTMANQPEFLKASMRVLEGEGFADYIAASNGATIVVAKGEQTDQVFNGILGYAIEARIREVVGATHKDMQAALTADLYIVNNEKETLIKCSGKQLAEILKEAIKRGENPNSGLKQQIGFGGIKDLTLKPITEYSVNIKFQRYLEDMKIKRDQHGINEVNELAGVKKFSIEKLFEFSRQIANARYYNIPHDVRKVFNEDAFEKRFKKAGTVDSGGFF